MAVKRRKAGKRSNGVNKSELIRELLRELGREARNKDVIARLKERSVDVSPAQVSNVKLALAKKSGLRFRRRRRRGGRGAGAASNDSISLASLVAAKKLAESMGGLDRARRALDALAKLS